MTRTLKAAEFKQTCLALMDEVAERGERILITKRGKIVAKLAPVADARRQALGCLKGALEIADEDFSLLPARVDGERPQGSGVVLLLDTQALVWLVLDSPRLGKLARRRAARMSRRSRSGSWRRSRRPVASDSG